MLSSEAVTLSSFHGASKACRHFNADVKSEREILRICGSCCLCCVCSATRRQRRHAGLPNSPMKSNLSPQLHCRRACSCTCSAMRWVLPPCQTAETRLYTRPTLKHFPDSTTFPLFCTLPKLNTLLTVYTAGGRAVIPAAPWDGQRHHAGLRARDCGSPSNPRRPGTCFVPLRGGTGTSYHKTSQNVQRLQPRARLRARSWGVSSDLWIPAARPPQPALMLHMYLCARLRARHRGGASRALRRLRDLRQRKSRSRLLHHAWIACCAWCPLGRLYTRTSSAHRCLVRW